MAQNNDKGRKRRQRHVTARKAFMTRVFKMWKEMSHFSEERVAKSKERVTESQERTVEASLLVAKSREAGPTKSAIDPKALRWDPFLCSESFG